MTTLRSSGPDYRSDDPVPTHYYRWKCPKCGDISEDPANIHETVCHNGHEIKLSLVHDGGNHECMVAEYEVPEFMPAWATHNFASEGGHKVHLIRPGMRPIPKRPSLCGRLLLPSGLGAPIPDLEKWINGAEQEVCAVCLRKARKILK